jgi:hypothetical protein
MRWCWPVVLGSSLACSGLLGGREAALLREAELDAADEAERARLQGDFDGAEAILRRRLSADANDARGWRLLGDVNLTRGQRFQQRWKENLGWAIEAYERSVKLDPSNCMAWGRLSAAVLSAAENDEVRVARERLDALPLAKGWSACPGAALLQLELERKPTSAELASARVPEDAGNLQRLAAAAPHMVAAVQKLDLSQLAWVSHLSWPEPAAGQPFVVLQVPTTGGSVEGSEPRTFSHPEWVVPSKRAGDRLVYPDRRFAAQVPQKAVTQATGCPGTTWTREGPERIPRGQCVAGPQDRSASPIYDPKLLQPAGVAHYHERSIKPAAIPWESVADKTVRCLGGSVGRLFIEVPACQVAYDEAIPQTRSLPVSSGKAAWSEEHAQRMVDAARGGALLGEPIAPHLVQGEVAAGLPYGLYVWSQPDLTGCKGRGVFSKLRIVDGALEFDCVVQETQYTFRELALTQIAGALTAP